MENNQSEHTRQFPAKQAATALLVLVPVIVAIEMVVLGRENRAAAPVFWGVAAALLIVAAIVPFLSPMRIELDEASVTWVYRSPRQSVSVPLQEIKGIQELTNGGFVLLLRGRPGPKCNPALFGHVGDLRDLLVRRAGLHPVTASDTRSVGRWER